MTSLPEMTPTAHSEDDGLRGIVSVHTSLGILELRWGMIAFCVACYFFVSARSDSMDGFVAAARMKYAVAACLTAFTAFEMRKLVWKVLVRERGLEIKRNRQLILGWKDIRFIKESTFPLADSNSVTIRTFDGRTIRLGVHFRRMDALAKLIRDAIARRILSEADVLFLKGESVDFGKLRFHSDHLEIEEKRLGFQDIKVVRVEFGMLKGIVLNVVSKEAKTPWYSKPVSEMPNLNAFKLLVERYGIRFEQKAMVPSLAVNPS